MEDKKGFHTKTDGHQIKVGQSALSHCGLLSPEGFNFCAGERRIIANAKDPSNILFSPCIYGVCMSI
jgi:hypothetical protein